MPEPVDRPALDNQPFDLLGKCHPVLAQRLSLLAVLLLSCLFSGLVQEYLILGNSGWGIMVSTWSCGFRFVAGGVGVGAQFWLNLSNPSSSNQCG